MASLKIYVSTDTTSISVGSEEIEAGLKKHISTVKLDATVIRGGSRGLYWLEPLIEVEQDGKRHAFGLLESSDIPGLFKSDNTLNLSSAKYMGLTENIPGLKLQNRFTFSRVGVIDPLDIEDYKAHGGLKGLKLALKMKSEDMIREVSESGLRGRGGAGFPTGIKMKTVNMTDATQKYVVCNADEGDSGTFADRMVLDSDPFMLIEGMVIAGIAVGANKGYIYLRSEYPYSKRIIKQAIDIACKHGLIGSNVLNSGHQFEIKLVIGAGAYICGEETSLLESIEGKPALIRAKPPLPAVSGLFGQPTLINNLLTLSTLPGIFSQSGKTYSELGTGKSRGTIHMQLSGNIKHGGLYEVPFGFSLKKLVMETGGGTISGKPIKCVQVGGPLGAFIPKNNLDIPIDYEAFGKESAMLGHGGVVVFDDTVNMAKMAKFSMEFCARESCGKCTPCRIGSTRGKEVIEKMMQNNQYSANRELLEDLCATLTEGSLCALGGLIPMPVNSALKYFENDFKEYHTSNK